MDAWEAKRRMKVKEWQEQVVACRNSGMSVREWCALNGVNTKTYYRHERTILDLICAEQRGLAASDSPVFAELPAPKHGPATRQTGQAAATVHMGAVEIDIYDGAGEATLRTLLRVLGHAA